MKIVMLTADYPPDVWSGIGVAVHRQAADLLALGADVRVVVQRPADGNRVLDLDDESRADWIHLHSLALTDSALELKRRLGAQLAYTVHTQPWLELGDRPRRRFWLDTQTRLLAACDRVVCLSAAELTAARTLFPRLPPASVIPNGVPPPPAVIPGPETRRDVIFAGRFAVSKGVLLLEDCIRHVRRTSDVRFTLAGGHGDAEGTAAVRRLARWCEVTGWLSREALDDRLMRARLVLVPSRYEPFGLVALEAMRVGTPLLAANVGGLRESVRDGSGGVRLDTADAREWAAAIERILSDDGGWTRLHRQGPAFVGQHYRSADLAARLLNDVYVATGVTERSSNRH
jgi:glycosyltransferase involved in cell wall biosynthesis